MTSERLCIGWREYAALPELDIPRIKAKIDTGAYTSTLHAINVLLVERHGTQYVSFDVTPYQKNEKKIISCCAPLVDRRWITDSGGRRELRYVIQTQLVLGSKKWSIDVTLTHRASLRFRMLLGRSALRDRCIIDPSHSYVLPRDSIQEK